MGQQRSYSWEFKLQMVHLLEKGEQNPSQISRDHHVTRSLLYVWWQLYQERGEAAFVPTQAFQSPPEVDRPQNAQEQIAHLERLWYYQHRRPSAHQESDQRRSLAIQEIREAFAGYGYRRVTKALARAGRIGQPQAGLAGDATSWPDVPPQATHGAYHRNETQPTWIYPHLVIRLQVEAPNRCWVADSRVCAVAGGFCVPGLSLARVFTRMHRLEPFSSYRCAAASSSGL